jgi:serine/threonine protein kinase
MSPALLADSSFGDRFLREGKILAKLAHTNVLSIYDIGASGNYYHMAMEYLTGGDLKERINSGLSLDQVVDISRQVAEALAYIHQEGFVHRDIKPENILFRSDGTAVLADYGIAKAADNSTSLTQVGMSVGTPHYMSPEQARGEEVDGRSDLYSLGVVIYEMFTGKVPYDAQDSFAIAYSHIYSELPRLQGNFKHYQPLLELLIAKNASERFQDAGEMLVALDAIAAGKKVSRKFTIGSSRQPKVERTARRGTGVKVVIVSVIFAVLLILGLIWKGSQRNDLPHLVAGSGAGAAITAEVHHDPRPTPAADILSRPLETVQHGQKDVPDKDPAPDARQDTGTDHFETQQPSERILILTGSSSEPELDGEQRGAQEQEIERRESAENYLMAAEESLASNRLSVPEGNNALFYYHKALEFDPNNEDAQRGIKKVAEKYALLASNALNNKDFKGAERYVDKIQEIYPQLPEISDLKELLSENIEATAIAAEEKSDPLFKAKRDIYRKLIVAADKALSLDMKGTALIKYRAALDIFPAGVEAFSGIKKASL